MQAPRHRGGLPKKQPAQQPALVQQPGRTVTFRPATFAGWIRNFTFRAHHSWVGQP